MIIILEGCDCVGKTTFANKLSERTGYEIVKGSSFEISELGADGMFEHMMELLDRNDIIIDRFYQSNYIYGSKYNYPMMSYEQYSALIEKMNKRALVVYLYAPVEVLEERMKNRGDEHIKTDDIKDIMETYRKVMTSKTAPRTMLSLNTHDSNFDIATSMVSEFAKMQETKMYIRNS
ncbi:thymidylate kinase [Bacillus phage PBC2]|uniref:Deoxynucleoside kinase n=1 Tax=Bacillus phage PBC2 TaxID=1675029 RepID=A0A218KBZ0_9CAUD|nr:thymidylate kinase [Bacillus phage PBC2]AKQ08398.1 deoxynucleoside kinase [Bacillus phage PBC2]